MDLLQTVRKEGSRGGVNFSWDDVKNSAHRENYLGHSIKAPVGRWQKGKDLSWYAKADDAHLTAEERKGKELEKKREELRKIKEAEEDAMAKALGLPVPDRTNANLQPLGMDKMKQSEMNQALKEALGDDEVGAQQYRKDEMSHHDGLERRKARSRSRDRDRRHHHKDRRHQRSRSRSSHGERRRNGHRHRRRSYSRDRSRGDDNYRFDSNNRRTSAEQEERFEDRSRRRGEGYSRRDTHKEASRSANEDDRRNHQRSRSRSPYHRHSESRRYER